MDLLCRDIENRVKDIKEQLDKLRKDLKENPLQVLFDIGVETFGEPVNTLLSLMLGDAGELGERAYENGRTVSEELWFEFWVKTKIIWTDILGTPVSDLLSLIMGDPGELGERAYEHGRTEGEELVLEIMAIAKITWTKFLGTPVSDLLSLIMGDPEKFGERADKHGKTVGEEFVFEIMAIAKIVWTDVIGSPVSNLLSLIIGDPEKLGERAAEAGRSVGEQFMLEFVKKIGEIFASNPVLQTTYEILTGRDLDDDLDKLDKKISGTSGKRYNPGVKPEGNSGTSGKKPGVKPEGNSGTRQNGKSAAEEYIEGWKSKLSDIKETGKAIFDKIFKGINNDGYATGSVYESGANLSISYADGLQSGKYEVSNAGQELFTSGYNGANDNGQGAQKYGDIAEGMSYLFASALGSKVSKDRAYDAGYSMANEGSWGAYDLQDDYEWTGDQAGRGYILGIMAHKLEAEQAGQSVANATLANLKEALGIASPSKEAYEAGKYFVEGFTNAIKDFSVKATEAANDMAEKSVKAAKISDSMFGGYSIPTSNNVGYKVGAINENSMAAFASSLYQAVVSGMSTVDLGKGDTKVIIDGKEIFTVVQSEGRKRGAAISNGAFST